MTTIPCARCPHVYDPDTGCLHGFDYCPDCAHLCRECQSDRADDHAYDMTRDER